MVKLVDYTTMRRNTNIHGMLVRTCPKCGRRGLCLLTTDGKLYMHTAERTPVGVEMLEGCEVKGTEHVNQV